MNAADSPVPAILAETSPRLRAQAAAVTLRIWHHLADDEARLLLFEPFRAHGHPFPLIEAILLTAAEPCTAFTLTLDSRQIRDGSRPLIEALGGALADIFGLPVASPPITAWQGVLDRLLDRIAARSERRSA